MTTPVPKERKCSKCEATFALNLTKCPECGTWVRTWSARRVAHALTVGQRDEDKSLRKRTAAVGGTGTVVALFLQAMAAYQSEAKSWREVSLKQTEITAKAVDRSTEAMGTLRDAVLAQTETFQSLNFTLNRMETTATEKAPPLKPVRIEAKPVRR